MALLLNANDSVSRSYSITKPSPLHPIYPSECGERTANFWNFQPSVEQAGVTLTWNGAKIVFSGICTSSANLTKSITLSAGTYTIKANANRIPIVDDNSCIDVYKASPYLMAKVSNRNAINGTANLTLEEETTVTLRICVQANINYDGFTLEPMLNLGSTPLPYEPYGYKLPLTVNGVEYPIYLGEAQTTRKIRKLVLDGTERFLKNNGQSTNYLYYASRTAIFPESINKTPVLCNELPVTNSSPQSDIGINTRNDYSVVYFNFGSIIMNAQPSGNTIAGLKEYLATQYAAGTPVTVWYVLAEPETGIVNEPLRKIGNYADTIDSTQTSAQIPTTANSTTISWAGEGLAPSQFDSIQEWVDIPTYTRVNGEWVEDN